MATLLERGISAAKKGDSAEAKVLLHQVLQADDRSERAWLWLSQVADTPEERLTYIDRVLDINPNNIAAQIARKKLNEQQQERKEHVQEQHLLGNKPIVPAHTPPFWLKNQMKKVSAPPIQVSKPVKRESVTPPSFVQESFTAFRTTVQEALEGATEETKPHPLTPPNAGGAHQTVFNPVVKRKVKKRTPNIAPMIEEEPIPLLPAVMFGTLSMTAAGGMLMIAYLMMVGW